MSAGVTHNDAPATPALLLWETQMRTAFIAAHPRFSRKKAGLYRVPAWSVLRPRRSRRG